MFLFEKAIQGSRKYWYWVFTLLAGVGAGFFFYLRQLDQGLGITGLSRDVTWGLYIAQFTFLAGVAASTAIVVALFYLYDYQAFGKIVVLGEFLAISASTMCLLFVFVDLGQPMRLPNMLLHPTPGSIMFWDMIALIGYLLINAVIALFTLRAERNGEPPSVWIKLVIVISIPWAVGMRTVSALLYAGLPGRTFWLTAILAPRALASAFAAGPALLILLCLAMRALHRFDAGKEAIQKLTQITAYAMLANLFFILMEVFTAFYSRIPGHMEAYEYLYMGMNGHTQPVLWMWASVVMATVGLILLLVPRTRKDERTLVLASTLVFFSLWIDKGVGMIVGGFVPSPLGAVTDYVPSTAELAIVLGIWAFGSLMMTVFYKITVSVREIET